MEKKHHYELADFGGSDLHIVRDGDITVAWVPRQIGNETPNGDITDAAKAVAEAILRGLNAD